MPRVFVSIGSNINREAHIQAGLAALRELDPDLMVSPVYETPAEGFVGDAFLNLVAAFDSDETPQVLNGQFKHIELAQGREPGCKKFAPRTLDIDLLLYGEAEIHEPGVQVPRDEIERYAFVLQPLADIAPELKYPGRDQSFSEMWQEKLADGSMTPAPAVDILTL